MCSRRRTGFLGPWIPALRSFTVTVIVVDAPGATHTGEKLLESPLKNDHMSPVDDVTELSKAWVTALRFALAVTDGAPVEGYGPISSGLSSHSPGLTSGSLSVTFALSPFIAARRRPPGVEPGRDIGVAREVLEVEGHRCTSRNARLELTRL